MQAEGKRRQRPPSALTRTIRNSDPRPRLTAWIARHPQTRLLKNAPEKAQPTPLVSFTSRRVPPRKSLKPSGDSVRRPEIDRLIRFSTIPTTMCEPGARGRRRQQCRGVGHKPGAVPSRLLKNSAAIERGLISISRSASGRQRSLGHRGHQPAAAISLGSRTRL